MFTLINFLYPRMPQGFTDENRIAKPIYSYQHRSGNNKLCVINKAGKWRSHKWNRCLILESLISSVATSGEIVKNKTSGLKGSKSVDVIFNRTLDRFCYNQESNSIFVYTLYHKYIINVAWRLKMLLSWTAAEQTKRPPCYLRKWPA